MPKFIELNLSSDERKVLINIDKIESVCPSFRNLYDGSTIPSTSIAFSGESNCNVVEDYYTVRKMIMDSQKEDCDANEC